MWLILSLSQAPVVLLFSYVYFRDPVEREPISLLVKTFALGALVCFPAGLLETWFEIPSGVGDGVGPERLFFAILLGVALVEESAKFIVLRFYAYNKKEFNEPYDGIMYAVSISLGFAAFENFFYVAAYGMSTAFLRMFTAVPMHAATGVIMGDYVGRAKYAANENERQRTFRTGLGLAVLFHGVYDYLLLLESPVLVLLALLVLGYQLRLARHAIAEYADQTPKEAIKAAALPPPPPQTLGETPKRLRWATRELHVLAFLSLLTGAAVICDYASEKTLLNPDGVMFLAVVLVPTAGLFQLLRVLARGLNRASRLCWLCSLGIFLVFLGTPLFPVGALGMWGLLSAQSRAFYWGDTPASA